MQLAAGLVVWAFEFLGWGGMLGLLIGFCSFILPKKETAHFH